MTNKKCYLFLLIVITIITIIIYNIGYGNKIKNFQKSFSNKLDDLFYFQVLITLLIFYNFCNNYKCFILLEEIFFSKLICVIINLLKNLYDIKKIHLEKIFSSNTGFYLCLIQISFYSKLKPTRLKISYIFSFIILSIIFWLINDIETIIWDICLGLFIHVLFFCFLKFESNNPRQFQKIFLFKKYYIQLILYVINLSFIILLVLICKQKNQSLKDHENIIYDFCLINMNFGILFGAKSEYTNTFHENFNLWVQYNFEYKFESEEDNDNVNDEESLTSKISVNKNTQWNHSSVLVSIIREIMIITIIIGLYYLFDKIKIKNFYISLIFFRLISLNFIGYGLFYLFKKIFRSLKMSNELVFQMIRESF